MKKSFITLFALAMMFVLLTTTAFASDKPMDTSRNLNAENYVGTEVAGITKSILPLSATNHQIRIYWSSNTIKNKIYSSYNNGTIIEHLYMGEIVLPTGSTYRKDLGSGYYEDWVQVEFFDNGPNCWAYGWMLEEAYVPGEWIIGGYLYTSTLDDVIDMESSEATDYMAVRVVGGVTYYGIRTRYNSAIYNSNGNYIESVPEDSWVWVTGSNVVGATHHDWMTINALSSTKTGTLTIFTSTTFFDADFNYVNPIYYNIYLRYWE